MISAIVLTHNEEKHIIDCIESISWCDEIIVVDDYSEDRTIEIIERLKNPKIKVIKRKLDGDFGKQRNYALEIAKNDWVLFIDADERVTVELAKEIKNETSRLKSRNVSGYYIGRRDNIWGRELKYGETGNIALLRLARKNSGIWRGMVHEEWNIKGKKGMLLHPIIHYPFVSIGEFLKKINFYTDRRAKELFDSGKNANFISIIIYPKGKFILNYLIKLGFLDGTAGFVHAMTMSFHSFLVRGKLWQLWQKK